MSSQARDWSAFHARWSRLRAPLRPDASVVAAVRAAIHGYEAHVLMLGVTPELSVLGDALDAVVWSPEMIAHIWPGDTPSRRAICADWRELPGALPRYSAVIGDGSLSTLRWPDDHRATFVELMGTLAPGARIALRCYLAPTVAESADGMRAAVVAGECASIHGLKWRLAGIARHMRDDANVPVGDILRLFDAIFPDRDELGAIAGWSDESVSDIDAYADSPMSYSFTTADELLAVLPPEFTGAHFVSSGDDELAERCPLRIANVRA